MDHFVLHSEYQPTGDQPQAIAELVKGFEEGNQFQTLLGVTGSGKTFTMANIIQALNRPTLIISHNKTLAGQLYGEMKEFFPENAVEYFVSYYDYYQPEAYIPSSDTYIAKDSMINDEIDKLRLSATASLAERRDVVVVASVSCIYGLGSPDEFKGMSISLRPGMEKDRDEVIKELIAIQYTRNDLSLERCNFRVRGDTVEVYPAQGGDYLIRIEWFGEEIDRICEVEQLSGRVHASLNHVMIWPASHYVVPQEKINRACDNIEVEMHEQVKFFKSQDKLIEAQRISERTNFDVEMMRETGFCSGIENYSRHLSFGRPGDPPLTLMDFFPEDLLIIVDESHMTIPQIGAMYHGDRSRKTTLVEYGFRLPSALDNRPLNFEEFESHIDQMLFVSATPGPYEQEHELLRAEQVIRPTGLLDPKIDVRPVRGQIDQDRRAARARADRRPDQRDQKDGRGEEQGAGHYFDQEDGGGPHGLSGGGGHPRQVPALGYRHAGAVADHQGHAAGRVRRAGGHQPAARGPGHPGDRAGGDPRRRQRGVPPVGDVARADNRASGQECGRPRRHVRGHDHGFDEEGHR